MNVWLLALLLILGGWDKADAQLWAPVLSSSRGSDWQGMVYTPPDTSTWAHCPGSPVDPVNAGTLQSIIDGCNTGTYSVPAPKKIVLSAGTFTIAFQLLITKGNLSIEGAGANQTEIVSSTTSSCALGVAAICFVSGNGGNGYPGGGGTPFISSITAGASKDSTSITVSLADGANYAVNDGVIINELNDDNTSSYAPSIGCQFLQLGCLGDNTRQIVQQNVITAKTCNTSCVFTLKAPLYYPGWKQSLSPQLWAYGNGVVGGRAAIRNYIQNVGVKNLKVTPTWTCFNCGGPNSYGAIQFMRTDGAWADGVMSNGCDSGCIMSYESINTVIRHSYLFNSRSAAGHDVSSQYGIVGNIATNLVAYNNILHQIQAPFTYNGWVNGSVIAYNYTRDQIAAYCPARDSITNNPLCPPFSNANQWQYPYNWASMWISHAGGMNSVLLEGNDFNSTVAEANEGTGCCFTYLRNRISGKEQNNGFDGLRYTTVFDLQGLSGRFVNSLGNVLGTTGYHNNYESSDGPHGTRGVIGQGGFAGESAIYRLGQDGGNGEKTGSLSTGYDPIVESSIYRWGNWDTYSNATRWCGTSSNTGWAANCGKGGSVGTPATEVPAGSGSFTQFVPSTETVPASFVFTSVPSWFGTVPWPPIGPDVSSGTISGLGGHANKIPARVCAESLGMLDNGTNGALNFNADCYSGGGSPPPPPPPTNTPRWSPRLNLRTAQSEHLHYTRYGMELPWTVER